MSHHGNMGDKSELVTTAPRNANTRAPRHWNRAARRAYMSNRYGKRSTDVHGKELEELRSARKRRNKAAKRARRRNRK